MMNYLTHNRFTFSKQRRINLSAMSFFLTMIILVITPTAFADFRHGDFENGTFAPADWIKTPLINNKITTTAVGNHIVDPKSIADLNLGTSPSDTTDLQSIVNGPAGTLQDFLMNGSTPTATLLAPFAGSYSALVNLNPPTGIARGSSSHGGRASSLKQRVTITSTDVDPSDGKVHVRFVLAPVLDNPGLKAPLTGTINAISSSANITGTGTRFSKELKVGDTIFIGDSNGANVTGSSTRVVSTIIDDTHLTVSSSLTVAGGNHAYAGPSNGHYQEEQPYFAVEMRKVSSVSDGTPVAVTGAPLNSTGQLFFQFNFSNHAGTVWNQVKNPNADTGATPRDYAYSQFQAFDIVPGNAKLTVGDTIELEVVASGCSPTGHEGHIYVDNFTMQPSTGLWVNASAPVSVSSANGTQITYTYTYTNNGSSPLTNAIVTPAMPQDNSAAHQDATYASVNGASCTASGGAAAIPATPGGALACDVGSLAPGATGSFTMTVTIPDGATGPISNGNYSIQADGVNPLLGPLVQTNLISPATLSDMAVDLTNLPATASLSSAYTGNFTCTNSGVSAAVNAICDAPVLPAGVTVSGCTLASNPWVAPAAVPVGGVVTCNVSGTPTTTGAIQVNGETAADNDPNTVNNKATKTVTVSISPAAANDVAGTNYNTPVTLGVSLNDSAGIGATLALGTIDLNPGVAGPQTTATIAGEGTFTANNNGTVTFTPILGFQGVATVPYTIQDNLTQTSNIADISVTVHDQAASINPLANDDNATTPLNTSVILALTSNDAPGTGNTLTPASVTLTGTTPADGTWTNHNDGTVTFAPASGFTGLATASYTVQDSASGISNVATITVLVTGAATPVARDDSGATLPVTAVTLPVLNNDIPGSGNTLTSGSINLSGITPSDGTWIANSNGTVTFLPASGFIGTATASYTVQDSASGTSNAATISVVVNSNAIPTALNDTASTALNTAVNITPASNDSGVGVIIDPSTVDLDTATGGIQRGPVTTAAGTWQVIDNAGTVTFTPTPGFVGVATLSYAISDNLGNRATANMSVTVGSPLPAATNDVANTNYNTPVTLPAFANDSAGMGFTLVLSSIDLDPNVAGQQTSATIVGEGTFTANINGTVTFTPVIGFQGVATVPYTIQDNLAQTSNIADITVTVYDQAASINPVANDDGATTALNTPVTLTLTNNDAPGTGISLIPSSVNLSGTTPGDGTWTNHNDGTVTFAPAAGFTGLASATYTVQDSASGTSNIASISVLVTGAAVPLARDDSGATLPATAVTIPVLNNDMPGNGSTLASGSIDLDPVTPGKQSTYTIANVGTFVANAGGTVTFTPVNGFAGIAVASYTVQDSGFVTSNTAAITIVVNTTAAPSAVNDSANTPMNTAVNLSPAVNDTAPGATLDSSTVDLDTTAGGIQGDPVTTAGGTWQVIDKSGTVTFTPNANFVGVATLTYAISDNLGNVGSATMSVTVSDPTATPDMSINLAGLPSIAKLGVPYNGSFSCSNLGTADATVGVTCTVSGLPAGVSIGSCTISPSAIAWTNGNSVPVGQTVTCSVSGVPTTPGNVAITGTASASGDSNAGNNAVSSQIPISAAGSNQAKAIPTLSEWGILIMSMLMLLVGRFYLPQRP
ncbi:MAG: IPTL-CTERM sorting domain-containing protein [Methylococcales bacterium]